MPLDAYLLRRRFDDLCFRAKDLLRDRAAQDRLKIIILAVLCAVPILWLAYRTLPENHAIVLDPNQAFLLEVGAVIAEYDEEDKYRYAEVGVFETEDAAVIRITGTVKSQEHIDELRQRIEALPAPAQLEWDVSVQRR